MTLVLVDSISSHSILAHLKVCPLFKAWANGPNLPWDCCSVSDLYLLYVCTGNNSGQVWFIHVHTCTRDCWRHFFSNRVINRWNRLDQQTVGASSLNVFKTRLRVIIEILGWASSWINPLGPGPPWGEFPTSEATQGELQGEYVPILLSPLLNMLCWVPLY